MKGGYFFSSAYTIVIFYNRKHIKRLYYIFLITYLIKLVECQIKVKIKVLTVSLTSGNGKLQLKRQLKLPSFHTLRVHCIEGGLREHVGRVVMIAIFIHTLSFQAQCPAHWRSTKGVDNRILSAFIWLPLLFLQRMSLKRFIQMNENVNTFTCFLNTYTVLLKMQGTLG